MSDQEKQVAPGSFAKLMMGAVPTPEPVVEKPAARARRQRKPKAVASHTDEIQPAASPAPAQSSNQASLQASKQDSKHASIIERIRDKLRAEAKSMQVTGKENIFTRVPPEEKRRLSSIVYTYKQLGTRTSENEIVRIALNYLMEDYEQNGKNSVLASVLDS